VGEDDLLQLGVAERVEVEVARAGRAAAGPFAFSTAPFCQEA
jgi:hypothetical protein